MELPGHLQVLLPEDQQEEDQQADEKDAEDGQSRNGRHTRVHLLSCGRTNTDAITSSGGGVYPVVAFRLIYFKYMKD